MWTKLPGWAQLLAASVSHASEDESPILEELVHGLHVTLAEELLQPVEMFADVVLDQLDAEPFFRLEMVVKRTLWHIYRGEDFGQSDRVKTFGEHDRLGGIEDALFCGQGRHRARRIDRSSLNSRPTRNL